MARLLPGALFLLVLLGGAWFLTHEGDRREPVRGLEALPPTSSEGAPSAPPLSSAPHSEAESELPSARVATEVETASAPDAAPIERPRRLVRGRVSDEFGAAIPQARVVFGSGGAFGSLRIDAVGPDGLPFGDLAETASGPDGTFELELELRGEVVVAVRSPGYAPLRTRRELAPSGETDLGDLVLQRGAVLSGHVVDASGSGIAGVRLYDQSASRTTGGMTLVQAGGEPLGVTDASGAFRVDELAAGPYRLRVSHDEHPSELLSGQLARPGAEESGLRVVLADGAEIEGRVLGLDPGDTSELAVRARPSETDFGNPLAGAAAARFADLESDGTFQLRGLREGELYRLTVVESGAEGPSLWSESRSAVVLVRSGERGVELELVAPSVLAFRVVDDATGAPLTSFEVEAGSPWREPLRDAEGRPLVQHEDGYVRFTDVPLRVGASTADLQVRAQGFQPWTREGIELVAGEETDLGLVRLVRAEQLRVRVLDRETGAPVRGARVTLRAAREPLAGDEVSFSFTEEVDVDVDGHEVELSGLGDGQVSRGKTDKEGFVSLDALAAERVELHVRHRKFAEHLSEPFDMRGASAEEREVRLGVGGTVTVRVVDAHGEPRAGARVRHRGPADDPNALNLGGPLEKTGPDGTLVFEHLAPGTHGFELDRRGGAPGFAARIVVRGAEGEAPSRGEEVLVTEGSVSEVVLRAAPQGTLVGQVTEGGEPLVGATLSFTAEGAGPEAGLGLVPMFGGAPSCDSDSEGEFRMEDLEVGEYTVRITHPSRAMAATYDLSVSEGEQTVNFPLFVSIVEGTIRDSQGRGVAGIEVRAERAGGDEGPRVMSAVMLVDEGGSSVSFGGPGGQRQSARTDAEGHFSLRGVAPEVDLVVTTDSPEHQDARSAEFRVGEGQTRSDVDVRVFQAGRIEVRVVDAEDNPMSFCVVRGSYDGALDEDESVDDAHAFAGEGGLASLGSLRPGRWSFTAQGLGMGGSDPDEEPTSEAVEVDVIAGETREVTLRLP